MVMGGVEWPCACGGCGGGWLGVRVQGDVLVGGWVADCEGEEGESMRRRGQDL